MILTLATGVPWDPGTMIIGGIDTPRQIAFCNRRNWISNRGFAVKSIVDFRDNNCEREMSCSGPRVPLGARRKARIVVRPVKWAATARRVPSQMMNIARHFARVIARFTAAPKSAGVAAISMPAFSSAAILSAAEPLPPEMIAPA